MNETLLIKHAVGGRTFIDSSKQTVSYDKQPAGSQWMFTVQVAPDISIEELLKWKKELNVFLFQEYDDDRPTTKIWFYVQADTVKYDKTKQELTFTAKSSIEYIPEQFGYKL